MKINPRKPHCLLVDWNANAVLNHILPPSTPLVAMLITSTHTNTQPMELCVLCIFGLSNWGELLGYWKQSSYEGGNIISCNQATQASYWTFLKTFSSLNYNLIFQ